MSTQTEVKLLTFPPVETELCSSTIYMNAIHVPIMELLFSCSGLQFYLTYRMMFLSISSNRHQYWGIFNTSAEYLLPSHHSSLSYSIGHRTHHASLADTSIQVGFDALAATMTLAAVWQTARYAARRPWPMTGIFSHLQWETRILIPCRYDPRRGKS